MLPGRTLVTFEPGRVQILARPGERLGDLASRAGFNVPYGCREGVCGTCEAKMKQPGGQVLPGEFVGGAFRNNSLLQH